MVKKTLAFIQALAPPSLSHRKKLPAHTFNNEAELLIFLCTTVFMEHA